MEEFIKIFNRDLDKLKAEISAFRSEEELWVVKDGIANSAGNLCLHILGNLNHFIGNVIGQTGYTRDREAEFQRKNMERAILLQMTEESKITVAGALENFDKNKLSDLYPIRVFGEDMTFGFFLIHLSGHLSYHLGQINYLRRILEA